MTRGNMWDIVGVLTKPLISDELEIYSELRFPKIKNNQKLPDFLFTFGVRLVGHNGRIIH